MITVITCTGHRPEAFQLCHAYLRRQTYKGPLQWIVVNDAYLPAEIPATQERYPEMELYAGPVKWKPDFNTHRFNMEEALKHVKGDKILVMEDDEFYRPNYIEEMSKLLDFADVVGEGNAKYYHLGVPGFKEMRNSLHASLCQTGITRNALPVLKLAVDSGELYFDIHLWRQVIDKKIPSILFRDINLCIGIKGMPGRGNIGAGARLKDYQYDPNISKLKEWVGADASNYLPFIKKKTYERRDTERGAREVLQSNPGELRDRTQRPGTKYPGPSKNSNGSGEARRNNGTSEPGSRSRDSAKGNIGPKASG